ncbi:hypothetical protein D9613_009231 [Agrocybe pediades]|uniref:2-(3-amino-3-carboxypropyl)histidine synthase subunit 2 n=1 Tax=Agrocybe pediades TaxID=84607 RepID=A0A8H4R550_9AGAR|nr:hypothetical protein D9613_009231 [Agrocybe pediades]
MVHYGHACMTLTSRLPVIYVFGQKAIDVDHCVQEFVSIFDSETSNGRPAEAVLLKHDVGYTHMAENILEKLRDALSRRNPAIPVLYQSVPLFSFAAPKPDTPPAENSQISDASPSNDRDLAMDIPAENVPIFYVGGESLGLTNLLMTNSSRNVYTYDPVTQKARHESSTGKTNKLLMRRYVAVQKAKDADVFGILIGTLGVASYLPLISHIRRLLARKQKKSYTISVGKLNPAKLANFLEIECFVLVACPENSMIEDKEFLRPIVTPYELEVAVQAEQSWTGQYVLDFEKLLANGNAIAAEDADKETEHKDEEQSDEDDPDQPTFSLVTGTYRHAKRYGGKRDESLSEQKLVEGTSAMVLRNQDAQIAKMDSAAGQFLQERTYQGLELRLGEDAPSVLEQGRSGIARGYQDDRAHKEP